MNFAMPAFLRPRLKVGSGLRLRPTPRRQGKQAPVGRPAAGDPPCASTGATRRDQGLPRTCLGPATSGRSDPWAPEVTGATPGVKRQHTHMVEPRASCRRDNQRRRQRGA